MMDKLRVGIIGGGIGGLATAAALAQRGIEATVFEQARTLGEVGAGVMVAPNSLRLLDRAGFMPEFESFAQRITEGSAYHRMDGTVVGPIRLGDSAGEYGIYGMHRADLLGMLASALPDGAVRTGHRATSFSQSVSSARAVFENGEVFEGDVIIGADGIHSVLRDEIVEPSEPVFSGLVAYRGLVSAADLPNWRTDVHMVWMGEGKHFMVFPVRSGEMLNFVGFLPREAPAKESWSGRGDVAELAAGFAGWDQRIVDLLAQVKEPFWWGLFDRAPLKRWVDGRFALTGDAAHAMLPHLGQGANQSIEDAFALAATLADATPETAPTALAAFEQIRRPRGSEVQAASRANGRRYDSQVDDLTKRDAEIGNTQTLRAWLYDYDLDAELAKA